MYEVILPLSDPGGILDLLILIFIALGSVPAVTVVQAQPPAPCPSELLLIFNKLGSRKAALVNNVCKVRIVCESELPINKRNELQKWTLQYPVSFQTALFGLVLIFGHVAHRGSG